MERSQLNLTSEAVQSIRAVVAEVFQIESISIGKAGEAALKFRGSFTMTPDKAYGQLAPLMRDMGLIVLFRRDAGQESIWIVPGSLPTSVASSTVNVILLVLTILSTLFVGTMMVYPDPSGEVDVIRHLWLGLPFALSLMVILGAHELGHYFAARQYGVPVTLPYFIPMPFGPFGTLGAFISMKAPPPNRRAFLTVAAAGPLAGFVLAVPILLVGLSMSPVTPLLPGGNVVMEGNSILYALLKVLTFGRFLPGGGEDVFLHPIAFAGWAGLLVTGLNLLPVGQLDGGHIVYALLGDKARNLTWPIIVILIALGLVWNGWFLWATLILIFGRRYAQPLDDLTTLTSRQRLVGWLVVLIFVLVFTPLPLTVY
jgi:membrane-associated protease RseP (regulator of RpoE activity)